MPCIVYVFTVNPNTAYILVRISFMTTLMKGQAYRSLLVFVYYNDDTDIFYILITIVHKTYEVKRRFNNDWFRYVAPRPKI